MERENLAAQEPLARRIGILGGTFNPPHLGHLRIAEQAHREFALDKVIVLPVGIPPHKQHFHPQKDTAKSFPNDYTGFCAVTLTHSP